MHRNQVNQSVISNWKFKKYIHNSIKYVKCLEIYLIKDMKDLYIKTTNHCGEKLKMN